MQKRHMLECPVCRNADWKRRYKIKEWDIGECTACGFTCIDPLPVRESRPGCYSKAKVIGRNTKQRGLLQRVSRGMKRLFKRLSKRDKNAIFYKRLCRYLPGQASILDIGCGDGSFLKLASRRFDSSGIEISKYLAGLAAKEDGIKIMRGNFLDMDFKGRRYEGVTLISLLEHLDDPAGALKKCFHLLHPGGVLLIKTVNYASMNRRIKKSAWTGLRPPDHIVYFSPHNLRRLLKDTGFRKMRFSAWSFNDNMYCDAWK